MAPTLGGEASRRGLLSSLADVAKRLISERDRSRSVGGVARHGAGASRPEELVVPVSSFRMVGLTEVQAKLADRWPAMAEKVHGVAQSVISRHMVRGDVFDRQGDDGYLVLFATLGPAEAEFKSRVIAREIVERLLGEGEAAGFDIATRCASIPAEALAAAASGDLEAVVGHALDAAPCLTDGASTTATAAEPADGRSAEAAPSYSPVWDTQQMTLLHFRAHIPRGDVEFRDRAREIQALKDDLALIRAVALDLQGLAAEGRRLPVTVAIDHANMASNSQRANLIQALARVPPGQRKLLTLEITCPADGFWTYGCKSFLETIRPLGLGLAALVGLDEPQAMPQPGPLRGVAVDLGGLPRRESACLRLLTAFGGYARGQGATCAAYGLASRALVLAAIGAGFRYVAGPAVHPDVAGLATALRFEPLDLYADVQRVAARS